MAEEYEEYEEYEDEPVEDSYEDETYEDETSLQKLISFLGQDNIADEVDEGELRDIGSRVIEEFDTDYCSLDEWRESYDESLKIAKQVREKKSWPWEGAANIRYPLISQACMTFNAQAYPEIVKGENVVQCVTVGDDPEKEKAERAERIAKHMSYQLLEEIPNWESDVDKMLMILPLVGTVFKEVAWNELEQRPSDDLLLPDELIVNNNAKSLDLSDCRRISKEFTLFMNDIIERERADLWLEIDYSSGSVETDDGEKITEDEQVFIQQLRYEDLIDEESGYKQPYVVTVHKDSGQVVRIIPLFDTDGIEINPDTLELVSIKPYALYVDFHFIPSFDGSFYSTGFGSYLLPINEAINTCFNQLLDAGTLANLGSGGFMAKGIRTRMGAKRMSPGEWMPVDTKGQDLRQGIVALPVREPSPTLFSLLQALIQIGKDMSSITDIGSNIPNGMNTPVGTTQMLLEQAMKVVDAAYKRIYRGLKKEYGMLYRLNNVYLENEIYQGILDVQADADADYDLDNFDIVPVGDSRLSTQVTRQMRSQEALQLAMQVGGDVKLAGRRVLEAMDISNPEEIIPEGPGSEELQMQMQEMQQFIEMSQQQIGQLSEQLQGKEEGRKDAELQLKIDELNLKMSESQHKVHEIMAKVEESKSKVAVNMATAQEKLANAEGQQIDNDATESGLLDVIETMTEDLSRG